MKLCNTLRHLLLGSPHCPLTARLCCSLRYVYPARSATVGRWYVEIALVSAEKQSTKYSGTFHSEVLAAAVADFINLKGTYSCKLVWKLQVAGIYGQQICVLVVVQKTALNMMPPNNVVAESQALVTGSQRMLMDDTLQI